MTKHKKRKLRSPAKVFLALIITLLLVIVYMANMDTTEVTAEQEIPKLELPITVQPQDVCTLNVVTCKEDIQFEALIIATYRIETGNGTSNLWLSHNNPGGIKDYYTGQYKKYDSKYDGMKDLETLLKRYVDEYGYDLAAIRYEYCGAHCGSNDLREFQMIYNEEINQYE